MPSAPAHPRSDTVLVVDFGAQYAQLIARRIRELDVYSEIVSHRITAAELAADPPAALVLSGGPKSVHVPGAPLLDPAIYELGIPTFGICYGAQLIAQQLGGTVGRGMRGEYGRATLTVTDRQSPLLADLPASQDVWMSHFDAVTEVPAGFAATASTADAPVAALESTERRIWGVQFHPEVVHTPHGQDVLRRFVVDLAGAPTSWTMHSIIDQEVAKVRAQVGGARVICGLSGGVDSSVAAALVHRAIGHQLTCVYVDTGLMRRGESEQVVETFRRNLGIELIHVDAGARFFERLAGVTDPEAKRKTIGELFVRIFEENTGGLTEAQFLVQGTLYPDVIESVGVTVRGGDQEPPQRRRAARGHDSGAGGAAARPVQGRGPPPRPRAGPARRDRLAPAVPRPWPRACGSSARSRPSASPFCNMPMPSCARRSPPPGWSGSCGKASPCWPTSAPSG